MQTITSRRHPLVHACRDARGGGDDQPLLLDGWHLLADAAASGVAIDTVAVGPEPPTASDAALLERLEGDGCHVVRVTDDILQAMSPVRTPSGVVALARRGAVSLAAVWERAPALVVMAIDLQDPGNVGALVRTAEAAGATGFIAAGATADPQGWKALRASMGSAFRLPLAKCPDAVAAVNEAKARGVRVCALVPREGVAPATLDLSVPTCLLLGAEGQGLSAAVRALADDALQLPMRPPVESLNVAVAGALALYAAAAQREAPR